MSDLIAVDIKGLMRLTGLGRNKCLQVGAVSGARYKLGSRTLYNPQIVKEYLERIRTGAIKETTDTAKEG